MLLFAKILRSQETWVSRGENVGNQAFSVGYIKTETADGQPSKNAKEALCPKERCGIEAEKVIFSIYISGS